MPKNNFKRFLIILALIIVIIAAVGSAGVVNKLVGSDLVNKLFPTKKTNTPVTTQIVTDEEASRIAVIERSSPSVVTVSGTAPSRPTIQFNPFNGGFSQGQSGPSQAQDIGSGFIVSADGLVVTNKHVVSDTSITYKVIDANNKEYTVTKISRDPNNDIAILKINASGLTPITLGDSTNLKTGQTVIAIGTALGQFRHTVTTGVISGLGRGIEAGDPYQGYVEQLDNIIQTDAAINPGNSGGPLINSSGQVIGINVAVAANAQNVGFAIPINVVKDALNVFNKNGNFPGKPFLGVQYQMITQKSAILNNVPQGAYVTDIVGGSAADKAGVQTSDIITKADGNALTDTNGGLAKVISNKKIGDSLKLDVWREGNTQTITATLTESSQ
jgi:serine protease Do